MRHRYDSHFWCFGICGLSCAIHLLKEGYDITIHEIRHEISNPVRSPGIIKILMLTS